MTDSGAERAARRIKEIIVQRFHAYHAGKGDAFPSVDELAAIIREETGTQEQKCQAALRDCLDDDGKWVHCTVSSHDRLAKLAAAPNEGGKR